MRSLVAATALVILLPGAAANAALTNSYQFNGKGNWSIDAIGSNSDPVGTVDMLVPAGSTIVQAFMYSSKIAFASPTAPQVQLDSTTYSATDWTPLGQNAFALQAFRADVTAQVAAKYDGVGGTYSFNVRELAENSDIDGEGLVVIYSNPAEVERTIAILDGFADTGGDTATLNFSAPLSDVGQPGFEALVSLGIGYGFQGSNQFSIVDGNGRRLTSSAGGQDDGTDFNGGLITFGGLGDSSANPDPFAPATNSRTDDELYDLAQGNIANPSPFLSNGLTSYEIITENPSNDDNIFFLGLNITARAGVDMPPPDPDGLIPEPISMVVWGALAAFGSIRGRAVRRCFSAATN